MQTPSFGVGRDFASIGCPMAHCGFRWMLLASLWACLGSLWVPPGPFNLSLARFGALGSLWVSLRCLCRKFSFLAPDDASSTNSFKRIERNREEWRYIYREREMGLWNDLVDGDCTGACVCMCTCLVTPGDMGLLRDVRRRKRERDFSALCV